MDIEEIRLNVFQRTGKGIDPDDPFFVAIAILSAVTEDMERKHDLVLADIKVEVGKINKPTIRADRNQAITSNPSSVNPWLAGFGTFGAIGGFMLGLALNKDSLLSMAVGFSVIIIGGAGCFFYYWRKNEHQ